ncbi:MAG: MSMEG_4193 family putative phosphomutase [Anaerolineales bacterium]|nr:MSMEG_4193 family putative phosphomutase [Anaerolineales bacterium]MCB9126947.1 MSMEG_4193 family putative phosphomutase [Ardenticatenales bacterium]MCB9171492.1 MSMEG_4193 family putative phosphomutase [Ardenticatenales bacterium]
MKRILLVRHGQNSMVGKRLAGWLPEVHLNDDGHGQARALAARLAPLRGQIAALYSSPLDRTRETAAHLAESLDLPVHPLDGIGEVRYGAWEGESIESLAKLDEWRIVQGFPSAMQFPDGERMRDVQMRAIQAIESVVATLGDNEAAIIVSHADLIKMVAAHYAGVHLDLFQRLVISPASLTVIGLTPYAPRLLTLNDVAHYQPLVGHSERSQREDDHDAPVEPKSLHEG